MRTTRFFMSAMAALSMTVFASCEKEDSTDPVEDIEFTAGATLGGRYNDNITLKAGDYTLTSSLQIEAPGSLTIEPGTTITAASNNNIIYILIEQGARINAEGTASSPITMTSEDKKAGAWGGLHICGCAHTNAGTGSSEIGNAVYGGDVENDNSGTIEYVIIENSGYALDSDHEANGISLYGVGSGTKISNVYVVNGSDDGIEFFGGSVNIDHCIVENCTDDSFDWTEGWNGTAEYIIAYQTVAECDCLMECDNNGDNNEAAPVAHPTIRYATFIGNGSTENKRGLRFREGTYVKLENALVCGKPSPVTLETSYTVASFDNGTSYIRNTVISGELVNEEGTGYDNAKFLAGEGNSVDTSLSAGTFTDKFVGKVGQSGAVSADDNWTSWIK